MLLTSLKIDFQFVEPIRRGKHRHGDAHEPVAFFGVS